MTTEIFTAILLIAVPIAFDLAFFELSRAFDYPNILRKIAWSLWLIAIGVFLLI
jgi:hypothetical protein